MNLGLTNFPPQLQRNKIRFSSFPLVPKTLKAMTENPVLQKSMVKRPVGLKPLNWRNDQVYADKVVVSKANWTYVTVD